MFPFRLIRRITNNPRPEDLIGPVADKLIHKLSFDFNGGKWMYMRVPDEMVMPVNEMPYVLDQPPPMTLAEITRRPIVMPDIEHGEKHDVDLFKDEWRWKRWGSIGVHGDLFIWVYAEFNANPEINERDEQQTRARLQRQWDRVQKEYRAAVALYLAKPWHPPIYTDLAQQVRESLHRFHGAYAIVDEGYDVMGNPTFTRRNPQWNYYVPISERIGLTIHIRMNKWQGARESRIPENDAWYVRGRQVISAILDSVEFVGPWPMFIGN